MVFFDEEPLVWHLPVKDAHEAWLSRFGPWTSAPLHDEIWDGTNKCFRARELTRQELKRVVFDDKVRRVMPSSVFWAYRRYRKELKQSEAHEGALDNDDDGLLETVPWEYVQELRENVGANAARQGLKPALKGANASPPPRPGRFSLAGLRRLGSSGRLGEPQGGDAGSASAPRGFMAAALEFIFGAPDAEGAAAALDEEAELAEAVPWLEKIARLDGLSRTTVHRSRSVTSVWGALEEALEKLQLLGLSVRWDAESLMQMVWPRTERRAPAWPM